MHSFDLDLFKTAVLATSRIEEFYLICNLDRAVLSQTGSGHFTPVAGYSEKENMVLLLDTARFKYPPHWVDAELLYHSVRVPTKIGTRRGFILLTRKAGELERATQSPGQVRIPKLPRVNFSEAYAQYLLKK